MASSHGSGRFVSALLAIRSRSCSSSTSARVREEDRGRALTDSDGDGEEQDGLVGDLASLRRGHARRGDRMNEVCLRANS